MEALDPLCDQFHEINLTDTFYDSLYLLCKYVDDETIGDVSATAFALEKFRNEPDYNNNLYKMWLYATVFKWLNIIKASGKFPINEESCAIYLIRAITEIARTAICYDGCNILSHLKHIITHSFTEYSITGWRFLCSEHTFEMLIKSRSTLSGISSNYEPEFETNYLVEAYGENIDIATETREYKEKCKVLIDIITEFLSSKFTLAIVKLAAQKFIERTVALKSDFVFNVPKTYHVWVDPIKPEKGPQKIDKTKSKDKKLFEMAIVSPQAPETEINLRDLYEILPLRMSEEANSDEFWNDLEQKYAETIESNSEKPTTMDDSSAADSKKGKKGKKGKKSDT